MPRENDHYRLTPDLINDGLATIGMSDSEFAACLGVTRKNMSRWFLDPAHPNYVQPPFWLTQLFGLITLPGGVERFRYLHQFYEIKGQSDAA